MKVFSEPGACCRARNDFLNAVRNGSTAVLSIMSPAWDIITTMRGIIFSTAATSPIWKATRISF